ncbi:vWA domain-containing protein [Nocardioides pantholopis]|uniref:vWA domain-containing protein n=1 Tax=Nocardioides pantholopis TaxID=2483798 RepID=UPI000FD7ABCE|nr:VWA domain-containing protein [Nocardioides pantholopis]
MPTGAALAASPTVSPAASPPAATTAATAAATEEAGRLMLVLDSSGSMKEPASGGQTRIEAAKEALRTVVADLPADQEVGLRVYGAQVFSAQDAGACTDSQLVVDPAIDNRGELTKAVDAYQPHGETPTGYALQEAGKDLGSEGRRTIILVSDGEPTCEPDPCVVARELTKNGVDVRIDVVGLDVNGAAREQLQCVAGAGNGTYYDVGSAEELADSLIRVTRRAARPYAAIGTPVTGATSPEQAPEIEPGDWLDRGELAAPEKHYRVQRTLESSTILTSVAFRTSRTGPDYVDVRLTTPDGASCGSASSVGSSNRLVSEATAASIFEGPDDPCLTSEELILVASYRGTAEEVPMEVKVTELPEVTNLDELQPAPTTATWVRPGGGPRTEVTGGTSFGDAEALTPGSYQGAIVPGETLTFTVEADWGQQVDAVAHYPALAGAAGQAAEGGPHTIMEVYSPSRAPAQAASTDQPIQNDVLLLTDGSTETAVTTGAISLANLDGRTDFPGSEAGAYTVTLYLEDTEENPSIAVPFELDLAVTGAPAGQPEFVETPIGGAEETPSEEPTATPEQEDTQEAAGAEADDEGGIPLVAAVGAAGAVVLVLLAVAVLLLSRRRRT